MMLITIPATMLLQTVVILQQIKVSEGELFRVFCEPIWPRHLQNVVSLLGNIP